MVSHIHYLNPDTATRDMNKLKNLLSTYGFSGPIWNTEASVPSTSFFSQLKTDQLNLEAKFHYRNACYELVRMYMENIANGVQRIFYYNLFDPWRFKEYSKPRDDINKINHGMWDENRMLKPIAAAHAAMVYALQGRKYSTRIDHKDFHVFIFEDNDGATAVQYAEFPSYQTEETISLKPTIRASLSDFKILDYMGNETIHDKTTGDIQLTISREPRYILLSGQGAGDVLKNIYTEAFLQHHNNE